MDPGLFSPDEKSRLTAWFQTVNRRAQTREWVDYFYGMAFSAPLKGPYENQEIGSGLLALLEHAGLGDPDLRSANREYLKQRRGWNQRFRNTDDAYIYQTEWLHNAFFQHLYQGTADEKNLPLSWEWLLLQALPDGAAPDYNMPAGTPLAETAYLGALLLRDPRYLWLAGRALDRCRSERRPVSAAPGLETEVDLVGISPTEGSCLLYGNSGLPTQNGPLAPDKIVFRDGWAKDSLYLLLNLRFSGWHRYKATNTVTLLYQGIPLTGDRMESRAFDWLPAGRRVFRDKRIPRENLNGLVVERVGLSRALFEMTRLGSLWAQDPPRTAVVEAFETGPEGDRSTTVIRNWHGWEQRRDIRFRPGGPVVITDRVAGPPRQHGALLWHLPAGATVQQNGWPAAGADTVLVKVAPGANPQGTAGKRSFEKEVRVETRAGRLRLVTVFLTKDWARAGVRLEGPPERLQVQVTDRERSLSIPVRP